MTTPKPRILLANDDGIDAPGIRALHAELRAHFDVLVVAPMRERSGAGCSLSLSNEMEVQTRSDAGKIWGYAVDGTPADCVKFAITALDGYRPDFVLSGINRGSNVGNSVFYSGTVAATIEATFFGLPAMAVSLACWGQPEAFYADSAKVVHKLLPWLLAQRHEPRTLWNLNLPNKRLSEFGKLRLTSHGTSFFVDDFKLYREEGDVRYYRNVGEKLVKGDSGPTSDDVLFGGEEISLSLLRTDLTMVIPPVALAALEATLAGHLGRKH